MNLDDLEAVLRKLRQAPARTVFFVLLLAVLALGAKYALKFVEIRAEKHASLDSPESEESSLPAGQTMSSAGEFSEVSEGLEGPSFQLKVTSVNSGKTKTVTVSQAATIEYLSRVGQRALGLSDKADAGGYHPFHIRWVVIHDKALKTWRSLARSEQVELYGLFVIDDHLMTSKNWDDKLMHLGLKDGMKVHLAAVEDEDYGLDEAMEGEDEDGGEG